MSTGFFAVLPNDVACGRLVHHFHLYKRKQQTRSTTNSTSKWYGSLNAILKSQHACNSNQAGIYLTLLLSDLGLQRPEERGTYL